jgi:hypothetical protein
LTFPLVRSSTECRHPFVFVSPFRSLRPERVPNPSQMKERHRLPSRSRQLGAGHRTRAQRIPFPTHGGSAPLRRAKASTAVGGKGPRRRIVYAGS